MRPTVPLQRAICHALRPIRPQTSRARREEDAQTHAAALLPQASSRRASSAESSLSHARDGEISTLPAGARQDLPVGTGAKAVPAEFPELGGNPKTLRGTGRVTDRKWTGSNATLPCLGVVSRGNKSQVSDS